MDNQRPNTPPGGVLSAQHRALTADHRRQPSGRRALGGPTTRHIRSLPAADGAGRVPTDPAGAAGAEGAGVPSAESAGRRGCTPAALSAAACRRRRLVPPRATCRRSHLSHQRRPAGSRTALVKIRRRQRRAIPGDGRELLRPAQSRSVPSPPAVQCMACVPTAAGRSTSTQRAPLSESLSHNQPAS